MTRRPFDLSMVGVAETHVDVTWGSGGKPTRLYSYWLKLQARPSWLSPRAECYRLLSLCNRVGKPDFADLKTKLLVELPA